MGVAGRTLRVLFRGTAGVASFGLGFAVFARPWPDSPMWVKPMELVKDGREVQDRRVEKESGGAAFADVDLFQKYARDERFKLVPVGKLIPEAHRYNQVSQGLMGLGQPVMLVDRKAGELVLFGKADNTNLVGLDGKIHNGIVLTLLDESLCFCGFDRLPSGRGVTANLKVNFQEKLAPGSSFVLTAKVDQARGRKVKIDGKLEVLSGRGAAGPTVADATCLLVEPKWFKWLNWVDLF
ncbi:hypothetical protein PICMEDRAFT_73870 [Pichia membranifaciens NRRL Y-2026]|uniref:Thioesterase domain-containing protein n=1 Tax=Pichia membranifaciens NRRL Y-2026 TaxID=763406 RepID=A0A1E3NG25_9ASCO|nr:hypothetical protein PICMEDRAFT_73870 [Pichia membranifaciens NRRL Y-2026]ODQ45084.1 hypothetical protein PICMEDRAFT_73870 [Pichia membranifaciens NRRL Y-2026]